MKIEDIVQGCKEGNRKCQDALVQKFAPGLLSLCLRYTSDKELARDALQECFINAFRFINQYRGNGSFEGWLRRIAVTSAISMQKNFRKVHFDDIAEEDCWQYSEIPDVYSQLGKEELMNLLHKLPESLFLVFNLYVVEGYHHNEIAEILQISESTSRSALCKARNRLIEIIKNQEKTIIMAKAS